MSDLGKNFGGTMFYLCDPKKNKMCNQSNCFLKGGPCFHTTNIAFVDLDREAAAHRLSDKKEGSIYGNFGRREDKKFNS